MQITSTPPPMHTPLPRSAGHWDRLRDLFDALAAAGRADPVVPVLQAVCETLTADAALYEPGPGRGPARVAGPPNASSDWARAVLGRLTGAAVAGERELLFCDLPAVPGADPAPVSAVLVCLDLPTDR